MATTPAVTVAPGAGAALSPVPPSSSSASGKKVMLLTVAAALLGASGAMGVLVLRRAMKFRGDRRRRRRLLESIPGPDLKAVSSSPRNGRQRRGGDSMLALLKHLLLGQGSGMSEQEGHEELVRRAGGLGKLLVTAHEQYGAVVRLVLDNELFVSINDPEILGELRVQRLDKRVEGLDFLRGLLGPNSVGFKKGEDAKKRRHILHKLFTKQSLDLLVPSFCACIARHVCALPVQCHEPVEVQAPMRQLWMALNALNVFGTEHDTVPLCESFGEALNLLLRLRFAPKDSVSDDEWRRLHTALHKLHSDIDGAIALHSSKPASASPPRDLLGLLLGEPSLTPQDVHDEVTTFLFATFENYTILSNTLHHLGKRPDLQRRLRQEWAQAFGDRSPRSLEELWSGLRLAKDVVKESLRLSVVGAQTWRVTEEECSLSIPLRTCHSHSHSGLHGGPVGRGGGAEDFGHNGLPAAALAAVSGAGAGAGSGRNSVRGKNVTLPKGTSIIIPMVSIHRNPKLWLNGDMFDPDRFRDGTAGDQHPLAFIPFGFGTRMCLGYRFALEISALVVSMVCKDLHLEACNDPVWEEASFNWYAKRGLYLKLTPLNQPPPTPTDFQPRPAQAKQQPTPPIPPPIITAQPLSSMSSSEASHEPSQQQQERGSQEEAQSQRRDRHAMQEAQQQ